MYPSNDNGSELIHIVLKTNGIKSHMVTQNLSHHMTFDSISNLFGISVTQIPKRLLSIRLTMQ